MKNYQSACTQMSQNNTTQLLFTGHVDHGKSTVCGHILLKVGYISERDMEKLEEESKKKKMGRWKYSWILDICDEERERGKTIDFCKIDFKYQNRNISLIDTPGHKLLIKQLIHGINVIASPKTIVGCLVISVIQREFSSGVQGGQTKEDLLILRASGVESLIVLLNKIDAVDWNQLMFEKLKNKLDQYIKKLEFKQVQYLPISGYNGDGLMDIIEIANSMADRMTCVASTTENKSNTPADCKIVMARIKIINCPSIISAGATYIMHVNDLECNIEIKRLIGKQYAKAGDVVVAVIADLNGDKIHCALDDRIIIRTADITMGFGKIIKTDNCTPRSNEP